MDEDGETLNIMCSACGAVGFSEGGDGFYYCVQCGSQADDIIDTGVADEDFIDKSTRGAIYQASHRRSAPAPTIKSEPNTSQFYSQSQLWSALTQTQTQTQNPRIPKKEEFDAAFNADPVSALGPTGPEDFGSSFPSGGSAAVSYESYYNEVRIRYVMGLQLMVQLQCEALVETFNVSPLIHGIAGLIWMRFLAATRVFDDGWADDNIHKSEVQIQGEPKDSKPRAMYRAEPHNIHGERAIMIWFRSLRKEIPLSCSLAISFLACHVAREPVLPTDIMRWSTEGKLPYFAAFIEIEKNIGAPSIACPLSSSLLFRPSHTVSPQNLESLAAGIAQRIGLELPPVNFHDIALRYLRKLSLPEETILPRACSIQIWSMPPDLWLSTSELRLPTRVCVMSILIVTIRMLYNIHGFGEWEESLNENDSASVGNNGDDSCARVETEAMGTGTSELSTKELLQKLHGAIYEDTVDAYVYPKDLPTYLQYCKDVVFAGLEPPFEDYEEEKVIEQLWDFYQNNKDVEPSEDRGIHSHSAFNQRRPGIDDQDVADSPLSKRDTTKRSKKSRTLSPNNRSVGSGTSSGDDHSSQISSGFQSLDSIGETSMESSKDRALRRLKLDMEENRFVYIPPRVKLKRLDYLHYERKRDDGSLAYVAHADYYILLRVCARVAQIDIRLMHMAVSSLERRLAWLENRIEHCLGVNPPKFTCKFCSGDGQDHVQDEITSLT